MFQTRLKELREAAGYKSQQTFADAFGVAQSTVGGWEAGKREPNYETTIRLANFFGVSVDYLINDEKGGLAMNAPGNCCDTIYLRRYLRKLRGESSLSEFSAKCRIDQDILENIEKGFDLHTGKPVFITIEILSQLAKNLHEDLAFLSCLALGMPEEDARMRTMAAMRVPYTFHDHLRRSRLSENLSQSELAKNLSIPFRDYKDLETGVQRPDAELVRTLAEKLNVDFNWLNCSIVYINSATKKPFDPGEYKPLIDSAFDPIERKGFSFPGFEVYPFYELAQRLGQNDIFELYNSDPITYSNLQTLFDVLKEMNYEGQKMILGHAKYLESTGEYKKDNSNKLDKTQGA